MNGEAGYIDGWVDFKEAIDAEMAPQFRASIRNLLRSDFEPVTTIVFKAVRDEAQGLGERLFAGIRMECDAAKLFLVGGGINDMAGARGDDLVHVQSFGSDCLCHQDMGLVKHIFVPDRSDRGNDPHVCRIANGIE